MNVAEVLENIKNELQTRAGLSASIRYTRESDVVELEARKVYLQPGGVKIERIAPRLSRKTFFVNLISEEHVDREDLEATAQSRVDELEDLATDFTTRPDVGGGAFVLSVKTFSDAAAGYNVSILEGGVSLLLAGVELEIVEN